MGAVRVSRGCQEFVKRESKVVNRLHESNNVKRVSRVVKRVQSRLQAHVKNVSGGCQESVKWMRIEAQNMSRGCHEGVKRVSRTQSLSRAWASCNSCQEVQCAERMSKICQEL